MRIILTKAALDWFDHNNISFHNRFGERLRPGQSIHFADDAAVEPYVGFHGGSTLCRMGTMSYTNSDLPTDIRVGRYCSLAYGLSFPRTRHPIEHISTSIFTHDPFTDLSIRFLRDHGPDYKRFHPNPQRGPISIGHDVWIGQSAAILPGVSLGIGCVVAANSVVTKSFGPYSIIGGNPASLIRMRFEPSIVNELLASEWWRYKFTDFKNLDVSNPAAFLVDFLRLKSSLDPYAPALIELREVANYGETAL